jgi:hypothetical protein
MAVHKKQSKPVVRKKQTKPRSTSSDARSFKDGCTFFKLQSDEWGVRAIGPNAHNLEYCVVKVETRNGEVKEVQLAKCLKVWYTVLVDVYKNKLQNERTTNG